MAQAKKSPQAASIDRTEVGERILTEAERIIAERGLPALGVRDLAKHADCAVGSVYYLFGDLDGVIVGVNERTLSRLDAALDEAATGAPPDRVLHALAKGYLAFAARETRLLRALFEHRMRDERPFPDALLATIGATFSRIERPLSTLMPGAKPTDVAMMARTLFSAAHGIVALGLEQRIVAVPLDSLEEQLMRFVDTFEKGLTAGHQRPPCHEDFPSA